MGPVELADGLVQLTPQPGINTWLLRGDDGITLVDTGLDAPGLRRALRRLGVAPREVTRVVLTHGHPDHAGGLRRLRAAGAAPAVLVGAGDLATVRGQAPQPASDPSTRLGRLFNRLPPPPLFRPYPAVRDAQVLADGAELPIAGGLRVVATPGHSPGHLALVLTAHDVVIGGDAVFNFLRLRPSPGFLCADAPLNLASIATLAGLDPGTLVLAHGAPVTGDVAGRLRQLGVDRG